MRRQIVKLDSSNDPLSRKGVPFWRLVDTAPHLESQIPKNLFGGRE